MRKSIVCGCGIMLAALVIGCGSSGPDATVKDMISAINDQASLMESKADKSKIEAAKARTDALKKKLDGFSKEEVTAAMDKNKEELMKASMRVLKASGLGDFFDKLKMPDFKGFPKP
jgi:hypothetical protein